MTNQEQYDLQRMQIFISQHLYVIASYLFIPFFISVSFWMIDSRVPEPILWWSCAAILLFVNRIRYHQVLKKMPPTRAAMKRCMLVLTIYYTCVIPFFWAYPMVYMSPDNLPMSLALMASSVILILGVVTNTLTLPRLYTGFVLMFSSILVLRLLYLDFPLYYYYVFMLVQVVISAFLMGSVHYKVTTQSIELRFQNTDLFSQLTEQKNLAEAANVAKSRFLVAASHDLSQPLNALSLSVGILERDNHSDSSSRLISHMKAAVAGLRNLFSDVSEISRLDADSISIDVKAVNLQSLTDDLLVEFESVALDKGLDLRSYIFDRWVLSDELQLRRIIRNLLSNAIKYTEVGGVLVGTRIARDGLRIEVWDTGQGIAKSEVSKIFDEFYQIGNVERDRSKGIGLGLSIVHRLCKLLGHELTIKSVPQQGSMFSVTLPNANIKVDQQNEPSSISYRANSSAEISLSGQRILVVDDEANIGEVMMQLLTAWGASVETASSLKDVHRVLDGFVPTLLISDYWLRQGETANTIMSAVYTQLGEKIPTLIITGTTSKKLFEFDIQESINVLYKPIDAEELQAALRDLVSPTD